MKRALLSVFIASSMNRSALGSVVLISFLVPSLVCGQAQLIRDINTQPDPIPMEYSEFTSDGNGNLYFVSEGRKFYRSNTNLTPQRPVMLRLLGHVSNLTVVGNTVFFVGEDGAGRELWRSNGTGGTTRKVKEIRAGSAGSNPMHLVNVNGVLFFSADDGVNGRELWKSDGTEAGTVRVKDIHPGNGSSNPEWITEMNGVVYFSAYEPARGENLWRSDGTAAGTVLVADIRSTNAVGEGPAWITHVNGTLFFSAEGVSTGIELWKSDGTKAGTRLVRDIYPGPPSSHISQLTAMNGAVYFSATNESTGLKLWRSDGVNTSMVTTLLEGETTDPNDPDFFFTAIGNYLYYLDYYTGHIVVTDGTPGMVSSVEEFHTADNPNFTAYNGMIYYLVISFDDDEYRNHLELRKMNADGTARALVKSFPYVVDYEAGEPRDFSLQMVEVNHALYFAAIPDVGKGYMIMRSDGTAGGTAEAGDSYTPTLSADPMLFTVLNGSTFFSARAGWYQELWRTDGTPEGTVMLQRMGEIFDVKTVGNLVYFAGTQHESFQVWRTDGTTAGTILLKDFGTAYRNITMTLEDVYGTVYFTPGHGELWKSNGTPSGTVFLKDFHDIEYIGYGGGRAIFFVRTSENATELWRSSGTTNSTAKLRTINPNPTLGKTYYPPKATVKDIFYFRGNDQDHGVELWRSNGTTSGTYMVKDIRQNDHNMNDIYSMFNHRDRLYFTAATTYGSPAIYESDGTAQGTTIFRGLPGAVGQSVIPYGDAFLVVSDYYQGDGYLSVAERTQSYYVKLLRDEPEVGIFHYVIVNNVVYFTYGRSLWRTDGTECGTSKVTTAVNVYPFVFNGTDFIFGALHPDYGREPFRLPLSADQGSPCGAPAEAASASLFSSGAKIASQFTYGPNPFTGSLNFSVEGNDDETVSLQVMSFTGDVIETVTDLGANTDHKLGEHWPRGVYVIKITRQGKTEQIRIVKK